ncbi:queuosine precursor transporter [Legionella fallonii]|uniref:Probable queuosine precursor transporter n=1 Tax=Legionella fallonii LLAP-10 TaxID=1212491 RepID=A0A098GA56_9GAMM|nr:queuosine precursor transporter [Legionella fallonii]CEG58867.1 conserved membrane protein of unknown function [Legionella fallonii LLAP-10]
MYLTEEQKNFASPPNIVAQNKQLPSKKIILMGMFFVSFLIVSNLTAFKVVQIYLTKDFFINFPAALIFFPLTYFFDDILTEVYGFKVSRLIIWGGLACSAFVALFTWLAVQLPASPIWDKNTNHGAHAYELVFSGSLRIFVASMLAYFLGEFLNSMALAYLKVITAGKYLSLRVMSSTAIGAGIDSIIFCNVAFWNVLPAKIIWEIILTQYLLKLGYEFIMLPVTYSLTHYLKRSEQIDYYDTHTKFNPFSLRLSD